MVIKVVLWLTDAAQCIRNFHFGVFLVQGLNGRVEVLHFIDASFAELPLIAEAALEQTGKVVGVDRRS